MLKKRNLVTNIFAVALLSLALSAIFGIVKPNKAEAAFSCSMKTPTRSGQQVTFSTSYSVSGTHEGDADYWIYALDSASGLNHFTNAKTYTFAWGSTHTVTGAIRFIGTESVYDPITRKTVKHAWKNGANCGSKTYTLPNTPPNGSISTSCSADGVLTGTMTVNDPNGGTPGWSMYIADNIANIGTTYGSKSFGPYNPPRNGVTYSITTYLVDPQTGGIYTGPSSSYICPNPPPPSCTLSASPAAVLPNGSSTLSWTTTNAALFSIDQGVGSPSPLSSGSVTVSPGTSSKTYTGTVTGAGGTSTCSATITIIPPPTGTITVQCNAVGNHITVRITNVNDPAAPGGNVAVSLLVKRYNNQTTTMTGTGTGNNIVLTPNPDNPGSFVPSYGDEASRTVSGTLTSVASGRTATLTPVIYSCVARPECSINLRSVSVGESFYLTMSLANNTPVSIPVQGPAAFSIVPGPSGAGLPYSDAAGYGTFTATIPAGGTMLIRSSNPLTLSAAGQYGIRWDVTVSPGVFALGDCGSVKTGALDGTTKPYVRFYGNDVIAGGGYGDCILSGTADAKGYGAFGSPQTHASYKGSASELAVFAAGQIDGILPGSQDVNRSPLGALGLANVSTGMGLLPFGGDFGEATCADDYWAVKPAGTDLSELTTNEVDLYNLDSGEYYYSGELHIHASNPIQPAKRITIYVTGNTVVGSVSSPASYRLAYDTSVPWADIDQIPLIRVITLGNIFIDRSMVQVDGMYVAVPDPANPDSTGEIHTCSAFSAGIDLTRPVLNQNLIATTCNQKLEVNGAFMAKRVHLLRVNGNVYSATAIPEPHGSPNIAEVFRFSPELYLALLSEGRTKASWGYDSILSLPPAF